MMCAWKELLALLPPGLRREVDHQGREGMRELRLRMGAPPEVILDGWSLWLKDKVTREDLSHIISAASRYSPWTAATMARGYLTGPGGHRIGVCGEAVCKDGRVEGIRDVDSVCIRVARDFSGIAPGPDQLAGSVLILGAPGWGKTTLLRDLSRQIGEKERITVIDERGELFPDGFRRGKRMDVLRHCPKKAGIPMALRTMGPACIAVDEITEEEDTAALIRAANCGVRLLATVHAVSGKELLRRATLRQLAETGIFDTLLVLRRDKSFSLERMET